MSTVDWLSFSSSPWKRDEDKVMKQKGGGDNNVTQHLKLWERKTSNIWKELCEHGEEGNVNYGF